jgi:hypothetical protein
VVLAKFEVLAEHLPGAAEENIENRLSVFSPQAFPNMEQEIIPTQPHIIENIGRMV